jgi:adenylate cyclase
MKRHEHAWYRLTRRLEYGTSGDVTIAGRHRGVAARNVFPMTTPGVANQRKAEASDHRGVLRRLRLLSGLVMFAYIATHLVNHGLGIISLALAESGLRLEMAFWRGTMPTTALYGAAAMHFSLALWALYHRREWRLPAIEILRLASGFSFPLLLFGHAVTTRLGDTLFGIRPSYELIIMNLMMAGRQGMQLALLAPGWVHGCLGLWITLRRFRAMQEIRHWLILLVVLVPFLAAGGFFRMASEIVALGPPPPVSPDAAIARDTLAAWRDDLTMGYLGAILAAFVLGRLHAMARRSN